MNNNLKVLKLFANSKDRTFTIKKAAEALKINYRIVYEEIMKLEKENLIKITVHGNSKVCGFNYTYHSKIVEVEEARKKEILENKDLKLIHKRISEVRNPFYILVIFGSYADKTNKKGSDADLCLITDNTEIKKEIQSILDITPINIHFLEFDSKQFLLMLKNREANVGNEIKKNNVVLHGIEAFYEMVNNAER